jgi:hypothetical protein
MTQDDIIKMAQKAGMFVHKEVQPEILAFADLVAAAEREGVAQMFEASPELISFAQNDQGGCVICGLNPKIAAKAIRARSKA